MNTRPTFHPASMDNALDLSRWNERPRGVAYRRWTIVASGLRQLFRLRFFRLLLMVAWLAGVLVAVAAFGISESIASGSWLERLATSIGPRMQALYSILGAFVLLYPDVCIGGLYTLLFWLHSFLALWLSLIALTTVVPRLITRDRATNALVIYLSRPLTSSDYLLGKLGTIVGTLLCVWTGPLVLGWLLAVAFAPNVDFIVHSVSPFGRALLFNAISTVALAAIALGVSATFQSARNAILLWIGLWVILGFLTTPPRTPVWLQRASFTHCLTEARSGILRPDAAFTRAAEVLPITDRQFANELTRAGVHTQSSDFDGALMSLGVFVALSSIVFLRRLRPE